MTEQKRISISHQVIIGEMQAQLEFLQGRSYQLSALLEGSQKDLADANERLMELQAENADLKQRLDGEAPSPDEVAGEAPEVEDAA